jgi:hypothetical protein
MYFAVAILLASVVQPLTPAQSREVERIEHILTSILAITTVGRTQCRHIPPFNRIKTGATNA